MTVATVTELTVFPIQIQWVAFQNNNNNNNNKKNEMTNFPI